jgi:O-antigen/teichoic acid export membrane protein
LNNFVKNISFLSFGKVSSTLVRFLAFSLITTSLTTEEYGQTLIIIGFCEFFQIFTLPGITKPLVRSTCRDIGQIDKLLSDKSGIRNLIAFFAIILVNLSASFMGYSDSVVGLVRAYSVILLIDSLRLYIRIVFKSFEVFKYIAISEVIHSVFYLFFVTISINYQLGIKGIVFSSIASVFISFLVDYFNSRKYSNFCLLGGFKFDKIFIVSASVFTFINIMWIIVSKIDVIMLSSMATSKDVALYGVANKIILFGVMGISVISNVIYPPIIKLINLNQLIIRKYIPGFFGFFSFLIISCVLVWQSSEFIIITISGEKYLAAHELLNIFLIFLILQSLAVPIKMIMYGLDKEKLLLKIVLPLPFIKIMLNFIFYNEFGLEGFAYSTVMVYAIFLLLLLTLNRRMLIKTLHINL